MAKTEQKIPEGSVLRDDGCICPAEVVEQQKDDERKKKRGMVCPYDPRFPNQNQTKHCYISFIDFQRCARLLGNYPGCQVFYRCFKSMCPHDWTEKWFDQMEKGTFPRKIYPPKPIVRTPPGDDFDTGEEEAEEEEHLGSC